MANISFDNIVYRHPRTVSQLPALDPTSPQQDNRLNDMDYFLVSHAKEEADAAGNSIYRYSSRKISAADLAIYYREQIIKELSAGGFPSDEWVKISGNDKKAAFDFDKTRLVYRAFCDEPYVNDDGQIVNFDITCRNEIFFKKTPRISGWISAITEPENAELAVNIKTAQGMFAYVSPFFIDSNSEFYSREYNVENAYEEEIFEAPTTESEKHNKYLFRMVGYHSVNTWIAPESGIFTCWGWVDIRSDPYVGSNCNAWIALEGMIHGKWRILQIHPFDKNNGMQLSYVSFTFPVAKGLELRLTSGFRVGTNSNKYQSANGSLANHIANCFVGGIYKANVTAQSVPDNSNLDSRSVSSTEKTFDFHMEQIDSKRSTVAELKATINELIAKLNALSEKSNGNQIVKGEIEENIENL